MATFVAIANDSSLAARGDRDLAVCCVCERGTVCVFVCACVCTMDVGAGLVGYVRECLIRRCVVGGGRVGV